MLVSLGAFHGINPGMGWLFAVALGMQERRRGAVLRALVPLGAGHALAVAGAVAAAIAIGGIVPMGALRWIVASVLISLGVMPAEIIAALRAPAEVPPSTWGPSAKRVSRSRRS